MNPDWNLAFSLTVSPLELLVRGTIMYWFIFGLLRAAGRRDVGPLGVADMLVLVLIADAAQNAMAGEYKSILDGMVLVATIIGWTMAVDRVSYHVPAIRRWLSPEMVCLVRDGQIMRRNLRREYITEAELMAELRLHGISELSDVRRAYMEADGNISVLRRRAAS